MPETVVSPLNFTFPASKSGDSLVAVQATFVVCVSPLYTAVLAVPAMATSIIAFVIVKFVGTESFQAPMPLTTIA